MSKKNGTVKENIAALQVLLEWFESDDFSLEASIDKYKEAERLAQLIEKQLLELKNEVNVLQQNVDTSI